MWYVYYIIYIVYVYVKYIHRRDMLIVEMPSFGYPYDNCHRDEFAYYNTYTTANIINTYIFMWDPV